MPLFKDPATIKFVAKKFILSTNDPDNPISTIRQVHPNDTGKIEVFLTNGKSYLDEIDTLSDLISITSNKAFLVTVKVDSEMTICFADRYSDKELKEKVLGAFTAYTELDPAINEKYYFEPNKMFPRRVIPKSVSTNISGKTRWHSYSSNQEVFFRGTTTFSYYVICPESDLDELTESLGEIMVGRVRNGLSGNCVASYSGRNLDSAKESEVETDEAIAQPETWITTIGATLGNKSGLGQVNYDGTDNLATGLKDIVNLVMKEIKVTVRDECEA